MPRHLLLSAAELLTGTYGLQAAATAIGMVSVLMLARIAMRPVLAHLEKPATTSVRKSGFHGGAPPV